MPRDTDGAASICGRPPPRTSRWTQGSLGLVRCHGVWLAQKDSLAAIAFTELSELSKRIAGRRSRSANDEVELGDLNEPRSFPAEWSFPKAYNESIADQRRANYCYLPKRLSARVPAPFASLLDGASSFVFPSANLRQIADAVQEALG